MTGWSEGDLYEGMITASPEQVGRTEQVSNEAMGEKAGKLSLLKKRQRGT